MIVIKKLALYLVELNSVRENDILVSRFNQSDTTLTHQIKLIIWVLIEGVLYRNNRSHMFYEKGVFKHFAKFTGKYL